MAKRRRRCRNCPDESTPGSDASSIAAEKLSSAKIEPRVISVEGEGQRLWNHVLFGTGTCIGMLRGYADLNMPGDPLPQLHELASRLSQVIKTLEGKHAVEHPAK